MSPPPLLPNANFVVLESHYDFAATKFGKGGNR